MGPHCLWNPIEIAKPGVQGHPPSGPSLHYLSHWFPDPSLGFHVKGSLAPFNLKSPFPHFFTQSLIVSYMAFCKLFKLHVFF
jgi:hypothetical protein